MPSKTHRIDWCVNECVCLCVCVRVFIVGDHGEETESIKK